MKCVRCASDKVSTVAKAPDGSGIWEVYNCGLCNFAWRSTEPKENIDPEKRDPWFQLDKDKVDDLPLIVPIVKH